MGGIEPGFKTYITICPTTVPNQIINCIIYCVFFICNMLYLDIYIFSCILSIIQTEQEKRNSYII